ncbi:MAG TPA: sugar ABC transporter permease [Methylomirabilota bacterium]|nr:sugar ABC transporter permease [Methylomirabilota bacterium]
MRGDRRFVTLLLLPTFFFLAMFYLYPTAYNLLNSFTDLSLFGLKRGGQWIGVRNYVELLASREFSRVLYNTTLWLTLIGVSVRIGLGVALAFLINSETLKRYRLTTLFHVLLLVPWATPPIVAVVIWRWMLDPRAGIVNRLLLGAGLTAEPIAFLSDVSFVWPALITIITWNTLPLVTLTFLASLKSMPAEVLEAASVDGANALQRAWHVVLPHLGPAIVVMTLMSTFWTFNNFAYVWLTTGAGPGLYTNVMATEVYLKAFVDGRMGYSAALGVVMAAIMTAFGLLYLRFVVRRELREVF